MAATANLPAAFVELFERYPALKECEHSLCSAFETVRDAFANGNKLLLCGNGGSAADCEHIMGELIKEFGKKRSFSPELLQALGPEIAQGLQPALPAISLVGFSGVATAYANDCDAVNLFAQLVLGLGKPGDVLLSISTSGNSANVLKATRVARALGLRTIALTGRSGGQLKALVDTPILAPSQRVDHIQEYHLPIYHAMCLAWENHFFPADEGRL